MFIYTNKNNNNNNNILPKKIYIIQSGENYFVNID